VVVRDLRGVDALRRRLVTSGRLAAIGELAAGIAHEVNNPAAFIRSDLNFLRDRLQEIHEALAKDDPKRQDEIFQKGFNRIDHAVEGVERIVEVVGDVRGFAHLGGEEGSESHPATIVEGAVRLARLERREEVGLHVAGAEGLQTVRAGQDLKQVLLALIRIMTISSRVGGSVEIRLKDEADGLGISLISDDLMQRAESQIHRFEMAREDVLAASTTDLGLAIAIELIDELGGALRVEAQSEFALSIDLLWPRGTGGAG
jgi:C4-dicarboxylate-specific signal transduction histidine kinase